MAIHINLTAQDGGVDLSKLFPPQQNHFHQTESDTTKSSGLDTDTAVHLALGVLTLAILLFFIVFTLAKCLLASRRDHKETGDARDGLVTQGTETGDTSTAALRAARLLRDPLCFQHDQRDTICTQSKEEHISNETVNTAIESSPAIAKHEKAIPKIDSAQDSDETESLCLSRKELDHSGFKSPPIRTKRSQSVHNFVYERTNIPSLRSTPELRVTQSTVKYKVLSQCPSIRVPESLPELCTFESEVSITRTLPRVHSVPIHMATTSFISAHAEASCKSLPSRMALEARHYTQVYSKRVNNITRLRYHSEGNWMYIQNTMNLS